MDGQRGALYDTEYGYGDKSGNLATIKRNAEKGGAPAAIDDITMEYESGSNRLKRVTDAQSATGYGDAVDMITEYTYDANGNITSDLNAESISGW